MWSGALRQVGGLCRPSLARVRSFACQSLASQISITARARPPTHMSQARVEFWNSGRLPVQVHGDKLGPLWLSFPYNDYMKMARKPHIQRKLLRVDIQASLEFVSFFNLLLLILECLVGIRQLRWLFLCNFALFFFFVLLNIVLFRMNLFF